MTSARVPANHNPHLSHASGPRESRIARFTVASQVRQLAVTDDSAVARTAHRLRELERRASPRASDHECSVAEVTWRIATARIDISQTRVPAANCFSAALCAHATYDVHSTGAVDRCSTRMSRRSLQMSVLWPTQDVGARRSLGAFAVRHPPAQFEQLRFASTSTSQSSVSAYMTFMYDFSSWIAPIFALR